MESRNLQHLQQPLSHHTSSSGPASTLAVSLPSCCSVGETETDREEGRVFSHGLAWPANFVLRNGNISSFEEEQPGRQVVMDGQRSRLTLGAGALGQSGSGCFLWRQELTQTFLCY